MEFDLRTPSYMFNHGGYYAPEDPSLCDFPGGPCEMCQERIDTDAATILANLYIRPACPSCHSRGTYISHASKGLRTCNGCEDMFCTKCYHGSRYCCAYHTLPPPPPVSRQCSTEKWQLAEEYLREHPEEFEAIAEIIPDQHIYLVRRTASGEFLRVHQSVKDVKKE